MSYLVELEFRKAPDVGTNKVHWVMRHGLKLGEIHRFEDCRILFYPAGERMSMAEMNMIGCKMDDIKHGW